MIRNRFITGLMATSILIGSVAPSFAYYSKTDYTETFEIQSNQSAFMIPLQGANKDSQAQFGSQAYYEANKVATKRVQIPHVKLTGSGCSTCYDYYVPSAKLIVVDRTQFNREWTDSEKTGTSTKPEGFHFESADSINIETDITIGASVSEENAAKFLYNFGVKPPTTAAINYDPTAQYQTDAFYAAQYASLSQGYSLQDVMDTLGRGEIQSELSNQFAKCPLVQCIGQKDKIMDNVRTAATKWFADRGITLQYIGYANSLNYDKEIQDAVNGVFIANQHAAAYRTQQDVMPIRQQIANVKVTESFADAIAQKWNGVLPALPNWLVFPSSFFNGITKALFGPDVKTTNTN